MMTTIRIEQYRNGQEIEIYQLIKKVYDEFVAIDYSEKGNKVFYNWIEPAKIALRQKDRINVWVAFIETKLVGIIEVRDNNHIALLFVDKEHHGRGIAKQLFHESLKECMQRDPNLDAFFVHASPYSGPIYRKLGFVETDTMKEEFGIKYWPMKMKIAKAPEL
jgi:GNAT superfamily N-acetyltransferase